MTTHWWLAAIAASAVLAFVAGYWIRLEEERARRITGRTIEFDRRKVGL